MKFETSSFETKVECNFMKGIARDAGNSEIAFMIKKTLEITQ
jgi:hypothetical protein